LPVQHKAGTGYPLIIYEWGCVVVRRAAAGGVPLACILFWWLYREIVFDIVRGKLGRYSFIIESALVSLL